MSANEDARQDWPEKLAEVVEDQNRERVRALALDEADLPTRVAILEKLHDLMMKRVGRIEANLPEIQHLQRIAQLEYLERPEGEDCHRCADRYEELLETTAELGKAVTELREMREAGEGVERLDATDAPEPKRAPHEFIPPNPEYCAACGYDREHAAHTPDSPEPEVPKEGGEAESVEGKISGHNTVHLGYGAFPENWPTGTRVKITRLPTDSEEDR